MIVPLVASIKLEEVRARVDRSLAASEAAQAEQEVKTDSALPWGHLVLRVLAAVALWDLAGLGLITDLATTPMPVVSIRSLVMSAEVTVVLVSTVPLVQPLRLRRASP
jgi:hypothetical protein